MNTFTKLWKRIYNPTVRGLNSKKSRQRKKALKNQLESPLHRAFADYIVYGRGMWKIEDKDGDIWQTSVIHDAKIFK